jgi:antitoxin component YwqK of YwqJK toxin-antitoxin module
MIKKLFALLLLLQSFYLLKGQKIEKYFDNNWKECSFENAMFFAMLEKKDSVWERKDYFVHQRTLQEHGFYKDEDCKIEHGLFKRYYFNGNLKTTYIAINGKIEGTQISYHINGIMSDSSTFINGKKLGGLSVGWHQNGNVRYERQVDSLGNGVFISYFDNEKVDSKGRLLNDTKTGTWVYYHYNGNKAQVCNYHADSVKSKTCYNENGELETCNFPDSNSTFSKGINGYKEYLQNKVYWPINYEFKNITKAAVTVYFTIDVTGKVKDAFVMQGFHTAFDVIALDIIKRSPKWIPARHKNRFVESYKKQVIHFAKGEE